MAIVISKESERRITSPNTLCVRLFFVMFPRVVQHSQKYRERERERENIEKELSSVVPGDWRAGHVALWARSSFLYFPSSIRLSKLRVLIQLLFLSTLHTECTWVTIWVTTVTSLFTCSSRGPMIFSFPLSPSLFLFLLIQLMNCVRLMNLQMNHPEQTLFSCSPLEGHLSSEEREREREREEKWKVLSSKTLSGPSRIVSDVTRSTVNRMKCVCLLERNKFVHCHPGYLLITKSSVFPFDSSLEASASGREREGEESFVHLLLFLLFCRDSTIRSKWKRTLSTFQPSKVDPDLVKEQRAREREREKRRRKESG